MQDQRPGTSSQTSTLYREQCETWYKRETRSGYTNGHAEARDGQSGRLHPPKPETPRPISQTQISDTSQEKSVAIEKSEDFDICAGCDPSRNEMITSKNYVKILANNISICSKHRLICEALLDVQKHESNDSQFLPFGGLIDNTGPKFSVNEDRRLRRAVRQLGEDAWNNIASSGQFAFGRTAQDLKERWFKLCVANYDEF